MDVNMAKFLGCATQDVSQKMFYGLRIGKLKNKIKLASLSYLDDSVPMANIDSPGDNVFPIFIRSLDRFDEIQKIK
jgi:hypothetical protein